MFEINSIFPSNQDNARINRYAMMRKLYNGDLDAWLSINTKIPPPTMQFDIVTHEPKVLDYDQQKEKYKSAVYNQKYKVLNVMRMIARKFSQLIFNKPIRIEDIPDNPITTNEIRRIIRDTKLHDKMKKMVRQQWVKGDGVLRLRTGSNPAYKDSPVQVMIESFNPEFFFPEYDGFGEMITAHLVSYKSRKNAQGKEQKYIAVESHTPGQIQYRIFEMSGNKINAELLFEYPIFKEILNVEQQIIDTKVDRILVWHVPLDSLDTNWGESKFDDILPIFDDINKKIGGISHILDIAGNPRLMLPESMSRRDESGNVIFNIQDVISIPPIPDQTTPGYLEIQGNSASIIVQYIQDLIDYACMLTSAPRSIFKTDRDQGESGVAIKRKNIATALEADDLIGTYRNVLSEVLYYAQLIENINQHKIKTTALGVTKYITANYNYEYPEVTIDYGIVEEMRDIVDTEVSKLTNKLTSQRRAIKAVNPTITSSDIDSLVAEINAEQTALPANQFRSEIVGQFQRDFSAAENPLSIATSEAQAVGA